MNHISVFKKSFFAFGEDDVPMLSAALSYYMVFAIGPLLLIVVSILGFFFGKTAVEGEVVRQMSGVVGGQAAAAIQTLIAGAQKQSTGIISLIIGLVLLLLSASGVFGQLKAALNQIWSIEPVPGRGVFAMIRERFLSFAMIVVIALLLGVSLVLTSFVSIIGSYFSGVLPASSILIQLLNLFISFWVILVLFALVYRILPDVKPAWHLVWGGATIASILFLVGQFVLSWYIGRSAVASTYGAAASLVSLLLWVYYSALIIFFGAEYIKISAQTRGVTVPVESYAYKTREVQAQAAGEDLSDLEQGIVYATGLIFKDIAESIDRRYFHKPKSFRQRVREKLKED